jgi:hypothetical protein
VKLIGCFARYRSAVTGRNRINENQVGYIQQRILVVHQFVRRRQQRAGVAHLHAPRPKRAQVQPDRSGTRPSVKREGHRPLGRIAHVVFRIRDVEHTSFRRSVFQLQQDRSCRCGVLDLLAANLDGVLGLHHLLFRLLLVLLLLLLLLLLLAGLFALVSFILVRFVRGFFSRFLRAHPSGCRGKHRHHSGDQDRSKFPH